MRKLIILAVAALLVVPAFAGTVTTAGNTDLEISGGLRIRWDYYNNVYDFYDHDADNDGDGYPDCPVDCDDDFSYMPWRANVIVKALLTRNVDVVVNFQGADYFGNNGGSYAWLGELWGPWYGHAPFAFEAGAGAPEVERPEVLFFEAYMHVRNAWDSNWSFKIGRQQMPLGSELLVGNDDWYDGLAFDGIRADAEYDMVNLTLFWHKIEKGFASGGLGIANEEDTDFYGVFGDWKISDALGLDSYLLRLNSNPMDGEFDNWTLGARVYTKENMGSIDWSAELAWQKNTWGDGTWAPNEVDGGGLLFDARGGWNFDDDMRFGLGLTYQSGDDDWTDEDWDGFWRMFGFDSYGRWGNADVLYSSFFAFQTYDIGSPFGWASGYIIPQLNFQMKANDSVTWGANLVYFLPAEDEFTDFDSGADADSANETFVYDWKLLEVDVWASYAYSEHLSVTGNISYLDPSADYGYNYSDSGATDTVVDLELDNAWRAFVNFKATF